MVASPLATRLDGEGRQYVSGNLMRDLCNADKMNLRTSKRKRSAQLVQKAPGNKVIGLALTMGSLSSLTLKTGKTWTGDLKTSGSDDQSPEGWRAQYGKVGQMCRLLISWGRRRRRRPWKQRGMIFWKG